MSKEANTYVPTFLPTFVHVRTYVPTYPPVVYMHDGFGASIGVAHSDLFIAVRVYLVVDGGIVAVVIVVVSFAPALEEHLAWRVYLRTREQCG